MNNIRLLSAAVAVTVLYSGFAMSAPALDSAGKCRDNGKFVDASLCKPTTPATTSGKCRDIKTKKFAKCSAPGTEPVPTAKAK